uniref:Uncharacterized protein LOC103504597 n=1 Tax=Rhizophora mucronata TaxID=61149 RepID=A0A2P2LSA3_RHIMU
MSRFCQPRIIVLDRYWAGTGIIDSKNRSKELNGETKGGDATGFGNFSEQAVQFSAGFSIIDDNYWLAVTSL